jgi:hypothetical protein
MNDVALFKAFRKSPLLFVQKIWNLVPQAVKPEHQDKVAELISKTFDEWEDAKKEFRLEWFEPFQKGKNLTWQQWLTLLSIEKALANQAKCRISIESGHGTGKSATLSWLLLWFLFCFKDAQIPCTAPTSTQIHDILWKEVAIWLGKMPKEIKEKYEWTNNYVKVKESPETWFARAATGNKENPEALAGVHGDFVMYLVDEASGVPDAIFNTAEGALTGETFLFIMISNHTRLLGHFHESHTTDRKNWQVLSFDSRESPIVEEGYVERIRDKHGEDSDEFRIRVAGKAPKEDAIDDQGYMPLLIETDLHYALDYQPVGVLRLGVDPAGEGTDETIWVVRDTFKAKIVARERVSNPKSIAQKTITLMSFYGIPQQEVWVDNFGEGANVALEIAAASQEFVNAINVNDDADDKERYINKRAEAFWRLRQWLRSGGDLVKDEHWKQLLTIKYRRELSGKLKIMGKREMQKLGIKSPDAADALMLTFVKELVSYGKGIAVPQDEGDFDRHSPISTI